MGKVTAGQQWVEAGVRLAVNMMNVVTKSLGFNDESAGGTDAAPSLWAVS